MKLFKSLSPFGPFVRFLKLNGTGACKRISDIIFYHCHHVISVVALIRGLMLKKHGGPRLCLKSILKNSTMFTRLSSVV